MLYTIADKHLLSVVFACLSVPSAGCLSEVATQSEAGNRETLHYCEGLKFEGAGVITGSEVDETPTNQTDLKKGFDSGVEELQEFSDGFELIIN
ncbi:hypothetical protein Q3G72_011769 [Acer saccharum]|nr:hypothetical protein Q3G72_011769 [Acer saccharum]